MSVQIRRLRPSIRIAMPVRAVPESRARSNVKRVIRRVSEYLPPTPQETPCRLWQGYATKDGYGRRKIVRDGINTTIEIHRWVMEQALGRRLERFEIVMHRCDNPPCYRLEHLELGTIAANNADMRAKGRGIDPPRNVYHGAAHPMHKLSGPDVARIRDYYADGWSVPTIAELFDVHRSTVANIVRGISWRAHDATEEALNEADE